MLNKANQTPSAKTFKGVVFSIIFSSISLGLFGGLIFFVRASVDPMPLMLFGFFAGFIAAVLINFSKIKEMRQLRSKVSVVSGV